ncbi:MAG: hypothetical protein ABI888_00785 [Chloroflexota bacterium]
MTDDGELIRLELENQLAAARAFLLSGSELEQRYGSALEIVGGISCSRCAAWDHQLFNRAIGAAVLTAIDRPAIAAIVRHYGTHGRVACIEVYDGITPQTTVSELADAGFVDSGHGYESHVLETDSAIDIAIGGVEVRRCAPAEYRHFAQMVRDGFAVGAGAAGDFVADLTVVGLRSMAETGAAFIAAVGGQDAGTGELVMTDRVAGCYSGTVAEAFRGRGIQKALIAARVNAGLALGRRIFISQTDPDSPSGHNLHDLGFRTLYRARWFTRPA